MITVKICIDSLEKVKKFSSIVTKENIDGELIEGVHIVDIKSIMGYFSLDLKKPIQLNLHSDNREILNKIRDFILEES